MRSSGLAMSLTAVLLAIAAAAPAAQAAGLSTSGGGSSSYDPGAIVTSFRWDKWQRGIEFGGRFDGRFGRGSNINAPPGDIEIEAGYHIWLNHIAEAHVLLGLGVSNGTFLYGLGLRLNLLEFIDDAYGEFRERGLQRGVLANLLKNFMIYASIDMLHFSFPTPDPSLGLTYPTSLWNFLPGLGAQWYFMLGESGGWANRYYFETSVMYMQINQSNYFLPYAGFGIELR